MRRNTTHGKSKTAEFRIWRSMKNRCTNPKCEAWKRYGKRGITVCPEWLNDFPTFLSDMGPRPTPNHSIDRINNDGPYSKDNCRWATCKVQQNNKRSNVMIEVNGARMTITQAAEMHGLSSHQVFDRVNNLGWPIAIALLLPIDQFIKH